MDVGYASTKSDHLARLRRIEGQVRGLQRMVEEDNYCIDVLTRLHRLPKPCKALRFASSTSTSIIALRARSQPVALRGRPS